MTLHIPYLAALTTYISYGFLFLFGHIRDTFRSFFPKSTESLKGYAPLCRDFEDFYTRRFYYRLQDCWNRPISSAPDAWIDVINRDSYDNNRTLVRKDTATRCLNLGSYNYLGFGAPDPFCTPRAIESLNLYGASNCSSRMEAGTTRLHVDLERYMAEYIGKPAAMVYGMGFATNSLTLPALVGKGSLIISDSLNHCSIIAGARASGAGIKVFQHNVPENLEQVLRTAIAEGQPRTHRPWKKVLIVVEGIYSMEGEVCRLPEIVEIKKKYKAYLFLDEAHSIGALGKTGRGVCEATGVDPADVDVLMGTFTKSFGSCGGYIAGSEELIAYLKSVSPGHLYATSMAPPAAEQILSALKLILGEDGSNRGLRKLNQLHDNCNWFRSELQRMGLEVLGDEDSPVMPIMIYHPGKIAAFARECLKRKLAVVVVGFPATPLLLGRARICISASHSRADLEYGLKALDEVADLVGLKYLPPLPPLQGDTPPSTSPTNGRLSPEVESKKED
eukprot:TRINITY_DN56422_c0_g1_i1.p1 TRINITY_DN56422_c0_g1~~TRINITY_DN56422_c0_g1_i1.p1  ORF type:complete len:504 (+),score=29.29 TRINITY_DN56422_c0_g1_i1:155-1666(+)